VSTPNEAGGIDSSPPLPHFEQELVNLLWLASVAKGGIHSRIARALFQEVQQIMEATGWSWGALPGPTL